MNTFIITLNGYGYMLKEHFRGKSLLEYAEKENFNSMAEKGRWGYIRLGKTYEKAYFSLFEDEANFPGESFIRSLSSKEFTGNVKTFFLGGFLTHSEGRIVETELRFSDKELCGLLETVSEGREKFRYSVNNGEILIGLEKHLPYRELPFPFSLRNQDFAKHLSDDGEFREINAIIMNSSRILGDHTINKVREDLSEPVGNLFWIWGMGKTKEVVPFSERIMKKTCYISLNNGLNGMPDYFGFERIGDISLYEENSLLWLNNSLDFNEKQSIMVKRFESFDRDYLGRIREISAAGEYRIIFIFDSFTGKNAVLNNEWGVYCAITNPSPPPFRMRKYVKKSRMFMEEFSR